MTNEQIRAELNELAGLLVPVVGTLMAVACRDEKEHCYGCECKVCRAFITVHECQSRLEVLARALAPAKREVTNPPPGYDCIMDEQLPRTGVS